MKLSIINFIKGIFVGIGNIIPGVSGGTLAISLGIFDQLIYVANHFFENLKKNIFFLLPIVLGAIFGIGAFSKLMDFLLLHYSVPTNAYFIGLVVGSIPLIYQKASMKTFKPLYFIPFILALLFVIFLVHLPISNERSDDLAITFTSIVQMFLGGAISSAAMVIPGLSGSFVMILMGMYGTVLQAISSFITAVFSFNIPLLINTCSLLIPLGIGVIVGFVVMAKGIALLLEKAYSFTYYTILGLILGSIYAMFADPEMYISGVSVPIIVVSLIVGAIGIATSLFLSKE